MKQYVYAVALFGAISFSIAAQAEALHSHSAKSPDDGDISRRLTPMELMIVTPTRMLQSLGKTIADTAVLDEQDIRNSGATDVPTLLRSLAGVEVVQGGGMGKQSSTFVRGTNSSHILVLLDGVRINSATAGTTQIDQMMLDQIERIEVVRGNVSSLYGSEAIGGVIQIFTKHGKGKPAFNASAGAGTQNTQRASAGYGGEEANTAYNVQVSKYRTDGVSAINSSLVPAVNPDKDGYENTSVLANVRHAVGESHSLTVSLYDSNATNQTDNSSGLITDVNSSISHIRKIALVSESRFSEGWQSKVQLSQGVDDIRSYLNGTPDAALGAQFKTTSDLLALQNTLSIGGRNVLVIGLERLKQQVDSSTLYSRTSRTDNSLFAGYTGNHDAQQVQLNLRRDQYSDFGTANTWLLGYNIDVAELWRVSASTATAFKAPTLNDLFYPFTDFGAWGTYQGNAYLKPERSRNNELGFHYANDRHRLDLVYFNNNIHDLIVGNNLFSGTVINLDDARIDGVELAYNGQFGDTGMRLAATWQNPRDAKTGQALLRRARNFSSVGFTRQLGELNVGGEWQYSGTRTDSDINTFVLTTLRAYDIVNLTASYSLDKRFDLSARVGNLFNRDYMLAHGYNTLGRSLFAGLNYRP